MGAPDNDDAGTRAGEPQRARQTPLFPLLEKAGARFEDHHGWQLPQSFGSFEQEYRAAKQAAGIADLSYRGKLAATGNDRVDYLHRMLSNEVKALEAGEGNYCFLLDAQGHILADLNLLAQRERLLLDCEPFLTASLQEQLDRFIIMDEVELENLSERLGTIAIEGPLSREVICPVLGLEPPHMKPLEHICLEGDPNVLLVRASQTGEGFWLIAPTERLPELWERLVRAGGPLGARPAGMAALEVARVEAGIPRYGTDIDESRIPQETGQFRALSFTKGCYPGQEIVERVRSRGHVNRKLAGLVATAGEPLAQNAGVFAEGREVGVTTSAVYSPALRRHIALAYLRRESAEPGTHVTVGDAAAEVVPLPFPRAEPR